MSSSTTTTTNATTSSTPSRSSSRLPRWTRHEILLLVEAKQNFEKQHKLFTLRTPGNKWALVSSYCRARGVDRGMLQCRKRWSNLACDFKKIKAWEANIKKKDKDNDNEERSVKEESYWVMRSDVRRGRKLAGCFDREVFEIMELEMKEEEEEEEKVFDSGSRGIEDGLFEEEEEGEEEEGEERMVVVNNEGQQMLPLVVMPISERKYSPANENSDPGNSNGKQQTDTDNPEKGSSSWEGQKRRKTSDDGETTSLENKLIEVLERNSRILYAQLEAHNLNCQLDRDQKKDQADGLLNIMTKLADALEKIADKL